MDIIANVLGLLSEPWVLMVLAGSLMFAAANYLDELLLDKYEQPIGVLVIISGGFGLVLMLAFGIAAAITGANLLMEPAIVAQSIGVGVLETLWAIPYLYAVNRRGALIAGPLFQGIPVVALAMEATIGVVPPLVHIIGAFFIIAGGILLSIEAEEDEEGVTTHSIDWGTVGLMLISVFLIALIYVLFKDASVSTSYIGVGFWSGLGMIGTTILIWVVWPPYRREFNAFCQKADGKAVGIQFLNEIMDTGGAYLTHLANTIGPSVMLVTAFNATQPILIGVIGAVLAWTGYTSISTQKRSWKLWAIIAVSIALIGTGTVIISQE